MTCMSYTWCVVPGDVCEKIAFRKGLKAHQVVKQKIKEYLWNNTGTPCGPKLLRRV